jgi:hypothetical protein
MDSKVKALKQPKSADPGWYQRIQKAKAARQQGIKAQSSQSKRQPGPRWYE